MRYLKLLPRQIGRFALAAAAVACVWIAPDTAHAGRNVALVIGNSNYKNVAQLPNPVNDAAMMAAVLTKAGFAVVTGRRDLGVAEMRKALRDFSDLAQDADIAVVYYAGHGIEVNGTNYLVPVDAVLDRDSDAEDEAISLDRVLRTLEPAKRLRLVILDACRDNPFSRSMKRSLGTRSITRGLAEVEPASSDTLIAFAAKAGSTATDGSGHDSPFTLALARHIATPGLDLRIAFGRVRDDVLKVTANRQEPFVYGSLGGDIVALVPAAVDQTAESRRDYEFAAQIGSKEAWQSFLAAHSTGFYAGLAHAQQDKLAEAERAATQAEEAKSKAEAAAKAKSDEYRRIIESQAGAKTDDSARRQIADNAKRERDDARSDADHARELAEQAAKHVDDIKRQAVEDARRQVDEAKRQAAADAKQKADEQARVAALGPPGKGLTLPAAIAPMDQTDLTRLLQAHLKRVGCDPGTTEGDWTESSKAALAQFNRFAHTSLDVKLASYGALEAVRGRKDRVCPLVCAKGQKADGDRCVQIVCGHGLMLDSEGICVKRVATKPPAQHEFAFLCGPVIGPAEMLHVQRQAFL